MSTPGLWALILHAHLPFVRHPEHREFLEERWFFEALTETYLPLLERFRRLAEEQVPFRLAISFSPTLLAMLADPLLADRYVRHLEHLMELSEKEIQRTRWQPPFQRLALLYHHRFSTVRRLFIETYRRDLIRVVRELAASRHLELMASCATHAFLPLLETQPAAVRAQIHLGVRAFEETFGWRPEGFWLPECGYAPGPEAWLRAEGIRYVVTEAHSILFGSPRPKYGIFAPVICPSGLAAFGRDLSTARSVWSATEGYPSHPDYREFHRDLGYELDPEYLRPALGGDDSRAPTGIKYYRITGPSEDKQPYDPDRALDQAARHAEHFIRSRCRQIQRLRRLMDRAPLIVSPYDAELFGHWWFEGPDWLELVFRKAPAAKDTFELIAPSDYFTRYPSNQPLQPEWSSWGAGGYAGTWLSGSNDWIYRHLHQMAERMVETARRFPQPDPLRRRALNQMARELLLAQASDWAFILKAQTHAAYAYRRLSDHLAHFTRLYETVLGGEINEGWLANLEADTALFPSLDYRIYAAPSRGT